MDQNLSLYYIFHCVAATENISRAAKELYISQPAVSKAISNLEESLQVTLFVRNSRGVKLTDEGKLLYEHTRTAFDAITRGEENLKKNHTLGVGHLRIGVSTTLCKYLLLPYLKGFIKENPHIKITIECQSSSHTMKLLENDTLDIGLVARQEHLKSFHFHSLGETQDIFVATKSYLDHLMLRESNHTDIFSTATILLLDEENISRKYIEEYFKSNQIEPTHILEVSNMDLLIEFAKIGLGVACVIKEFVLPELEAGALIEIPLKNPVNKREVGFVYANNTYLSEGIQKFLQFIRKS
ncbi:MAG: hypothetical protein K0S47_2509 [Herbinix sp.]|jgi:DNA-binding transcriptional LysR family regulator|nr:hypothetical protein [Herbinix sp.]